MKNSLRIDIIRISPALGCIAICFHLASCSQQTDNTQIRSEIERILAIQENAYGDKSPEALQRMKDTCEDSLIFIGGDDGGMATSSTGYVNDLADGYSKRPYNKYFRIYDNTVIVTSLHQSYKLLADDTLFLNVRYTKMFRKNGNEWKMAYVTYAPLPVVYTKTYSGDAKKFTDYQGTYQIEKSVTDAISVDNGRVYSTIGSNRSELIPINDSTFIGQGYFGKVVFARNKKGKVTHYYFEWLDGQQINFPKID